MSSDLHFQTQIAIEIKRLLYQTIKETISYLKIKKITCKEIHNARKNFKKIRAIIRLIRSEIGEDLYREKNIFYRDLSRILGGLRDLSSMIEALERFQSRSRTHISKSAIKISIEQLKQKEKEVFQHLNKQGVIKSIILKLTEQINSFEKIELKAQPNSIFHLGMKRVYKTGVKSLNNCLATKSDDALHELRKQTKYLMHHFQVLINIWLPVMKGYEHDFHLLSDILGEEHDLVLLKEYLQKHNIKLSDSELNSLMQIIYKSRTRLTQKALHFAQMVYNEKPNQFVTKFRNVYKIKNFS